MNDAYSTLLDLFITETGKSKITADKKDLLQNYCGNALQELSLSVAVIPCSVPDTNEQHR